VLVQAKQAPLGMHKAGGMGYTSSKKQKAKKKMQSKEGGQ
jgi:hypothetical protein